MADVLFVMYIVICVVILVGALTPAGKESQQEYMAFKTTRKYMHSKGLRWPPREGLD